MNKDEFEDRWKTMRGQTRPWWDEFTEADLSRVAGKFENFIDVLQEKRGFSREDAILEYHRQVIEYEAYQKRRGASSQ